GADRRNAVLSAATPLAVCQRCYFRSDTSHAPLTRLAFCYHSRISARLTVCDRRATNNVSDQTQDTGGRPARACERSMARVGNWTLCCDGYAAVCGRCRR